MNVFFYDKTFDGLLSAVFDAYIRKIFPDRLLHPDDIPPLCALNLHTVETAAEKYARVFKGLRGKLSAEDLRGLMLVWLSEEPGSDELLFRVIRSAFDSPRPQTLNFADPDMLAFRQLARKVSGERHMMLGLARFQKTGENIYFSAVSPRYNVVPLLLPHFAARFADQKWIIYDAGRRFGFFFDLLGFHEISMDRAQQARLKDGKLDAALLAENEEAFQNLWKNYTRAVTIKERVNLKLQRRLMPRRYWKYLTEKQY